MADRDLYAILGVGKNAAPDEIKSAFRSKAKEIHPDMIQDETQKKAAEEKFKELGEAYSILSDAEKRQKYDQYGYDGMKNAGGYSGYGGGFGDMEDVFGDLSGIFGEMFGFSGGSRSSGRRRRSGDDLRVDEELSYEEVVSGKKETLEVSRKENCETCKGSGLKPGTQKKTCKTCGGAGKVRQSSGFFSVVTTCPTCGGAGSVAEAYCPDCDGSGVRMKKRKIEVKIPAGVDDGSYMKLEGQGNSGSNGGGAGDLYVVMHLKPHEIFKREGPDVFMDLPVTLSQAVLGDEIEIPTLYGAYSLKIPAGSQSGDEISIRERGFPASAGSSTKGSMHVILRVEIPKGINSKLKEAYNNVKVLESEDNYDRVKKSRRTFKKYTTR
jgi:molecular chaperone DnaJ